MVFSTLNNSRICRLCAEESDSGCSLYNNNETEQNLSELINTYLPIKLSNDGVLPQTICPGCNIQLEATMEFINLIIKGQKILRELVNIKPNCQEGDPEAGVEIIVTEINPDTVYSEEHPIVLQALGLDKPKRKRGRPKKVKADDEVYIEVEQPPEDTEQLKDTLEISGKRKRKTPSRFKEAVQGKELERIFIQEGMTDGEQSEEEEVKPPVVAPKPGPGEVIGHSEVSGELVVMVKGKGRGRPKGRTGSSKQSCVICGMVFTCVGRYMCHVAQHGRVRYRCVTCGVTNDTRLLHEQHQLELQHEGLEVLDMPKEQNSEESNVPETSTPIEEQEPVTVEVDDPTVEPENISKLKEQPNESDTTEMEESQKQENVEVYVEEDYANDIINNGDMAPESELVADADIKQEVIEKSPSKKPKKPDAKEKKEVKNKLQCQHCDKVFATKQSKSIHMKAVHAKERPYICRVCGAAFPYPRSLTLHTLSHRRNDTSVGYACDLCGKVLSHPSSVAYHKESEHGGQSYKCGKCGKTFKHKQLLQRHQLVHTQHRPYQCKDCDATFKTKANLLNHQSLHSGIKKFGCNLCKQKFAHKTSLTLHLRWHTGDKPYVCAVCKKGFTQKGNLAEHVRIHTGEKPYRCKLCPRTFTTSSQHKLHMRRHNDDRSYACQHCGKQFVNRESWRGHVRREGSARRHRCECGRAFAERYALTNHTRAHTGERPFRCSHCPRAFADRSNRNKHMRQVHKQMSLLASSPPAESPAASPPRDLEDPTIFVTYDINGEHNALHIIGSQQEEPMETLEPIEEEGPLTAVVYSGSTMLTSAQRPPSPALYYDDDDQHVTVTDEEGNPVHFTMQDGTPLTITSLDGKSLQVITEDGQTIPVEINRLTNDEEVQSTADMPELSLQKSLDEDVPTVAQYFSIV